MVNLTIENRVEEKIVTLKLSDHDLFLLKWSLDLMARNYHIGSNLKPDIDNLRSKLNTKQKQLV